MTDRISAATAEVERFSSTGYRERIIGTVGRTPL
jgi:hypothetical protein